MSLTEQRHWGVSVCNVLFYVTVAGVIANIVLGFATGSFDLILTIISVMTWGVGTYTLKASMKANPSTFKAMLGVVLLVIILGLFSYQIGMGILEGISEACAEGFC